MAITIGLSLLAILTQSLTQLDLLVERGQSPFTLLYISLLATPQFMAIVSPIALFATATTVYSRLYSENELVVAYSAGQSTWNLITPIIYLSGLVAFGILFVNVFAQPLTHRIMREKLYSIRTDLATTLVREGQFRQPVEGLTVYTRKIVRNGGMQGLVISDSRTPLGAVTYVAKEGAIVKINGIPSISMTEGTVQRKTEDGKQELLGFSQYVFELDGFILDNSPIFYKPMERYTSDLIHPDMKNEWNKKNYGDIFSELIRRFASPLNSIAAAIFGVLAIVGSSYSRRGYSAGIIKTSAYLLLLLLFQSASQSFLEKNIWANFLPFLVPILAIVLSLYSLGIFKRFEFLKNNQSLQLRGTV